MATHPFYYFVALLLAFLASTPIGDAAAAPPAYRVTDLGTLGGTSSTANGINIYGEVAGRSTTGSDDTHPFMWTPTTPNGATGAMVDLGTLGGETGGSGFGVAGWGVNDSGQVAGLSYTTGNAEIHAFYTTARCTTWERWEEVPVGDWASTPAGR